MKHLKKFSKIFLILFCLGFTILAAANLRVLWYEQYIVPAEEVAPYTVALVFGGGMYPDGSMSEFQEDRVIQAIALYHSGQVAQLIMTGDDGNNRVDEVHAMQQYAIDRGVAAEDVSVDPHGYNTYSSCYRAKQVYGLDKETTIIAISQTFHLPRIIFFCRQFGVDTIGVAADLRDYGMMGRVWNMGGREILARLKGVIEKDVTHPLPMEYDVLGTEELSV